MSQKNHDPAEPRLDPLLPGKSTVQLRIGDTIALCVQRGGKFCVISSEGFVELGSSLRELELSTTVPWTLLDCMWVVTQKHQYDAQRNLQRYRQKSSQQSLKQGDQKRVMSKSATPLSVGDVAASAMSVSSRQARELQDAQRRAQTEFQAALLTERLSNAARNEEKRGMAITYGETIQLMHLKSRKYMVFNPKRRALAMGCYSVRLEAEGSDDAWLTVGPCYPFQFEGGAVYNHDMLTLHSVKRQLWLHCGASEAVDYLGEGGPSALGTAAAASHGPALAIADEVNAAPIGTALQLVVLRSCTCRKAH